MGFGGKISERAALAMRGLPFEASARGASLARGAVLAFDLATLALSEAGGGALAFALSEGFAFAFALGLALARSRAFVGELTGAERLATARADDAFGRAGFTLGRAARAAAFFWGFFEFLGIPITRLEVATTNTVPNRNTVFKCIAIPVLVRARPGLRARLPW